MDISGELRSLEHGGILLAEGYSLFEAMSATELFDKKIDLKLGLADADTPDKLLQQGAIKKGSQLSSEELVGLFDLVFSKLSCWLNGNALAQSVYTLVYQYDSTLWDCSFVRALFETLNTAGSFIFKVIREAPFLREEDYNPSVFSFRNKRIGTIQELLTNLLNPLDSELSGKLKKTKQPTVNDALSARVKLLKGLASLVQCMSTPYSNENHKIILEQVDFIRKRYDIVVQTKSLGANMQNYESSTIIKHIRSLISMRKIPVMEDQYGYLKSMLDQIEAVLDLSTERNYFAIQEKICNIVHNYPKNVLVRAYLEQNLFKYDQFLYFHSVPWINIIIGTLNKMFPQNFDQLQQNVYKEYQDCLVPVTYEYVIKQLRAKFRKSRDIHKNYSHLSILIHHSNQIDQEAYKNKNPLMIFSYEIAVQAMIQQLQYGFELELYSDVDYAGTFFYLEYLTTVLDRNRTNYISQLSNSQREQLQSQNKKKQKVSPIIDQLYYELPYWKGLNSLFKGLSRFCYALLENGQIQKVQNMEFRYSNRLKIFEQCFYIKPIKYDEYQQKMTSYGNFQETLRFVSTSLSEAQQQFNLVKENKSLPQWMQDQARDLVKICVITSVNAMRLITNQQQKIKFSKTAIPFVPQIELLQ